MTAEQKIEFERVVRNLVRYAYGETGKTVTVYSCRQAWATSPEAFEKSNGRHIAILYNPNELYHPTESIFADFARKINPVYDNFNPIVISILHEVGHLRTLNTLKEFYPNYNRFFSILALESNYNTDSELNYHYMRLPDERLATTWALEWLTYERNANYAHRFEKALAKILN